MPSFNEVTRGVGKQRVTERHPYTGGGVDGLAAQVTVLLKEEQDAQRIILDVTKDYIHLEKLVKGATNVDEEAIRLDTVLRHVPMREKNRVAGVSATEHIVDMCREITDEGLEVVLMLTGNMVTLDKQIGISQKNPRVCGVRVKRLRNVDEDTFIVCGAEWLEAEPEDIRLTIKGAIAL